MNANHALASLRRFTFDIRPHHRETLDSYSHRVLTANFEPASLRSSLLREADHAVKVEWIDILRAKTGRDLRFEAAEAGGLRHRDGSSCQHCIDLISRRYACTKCSHGAVVEQHPHFDSPVCARHGRWIGFDLHPADQHDVTAEHQEAALTFAKLRNNHRLDVRLFLALQNAALTEHPNLKDADVFPTVIKVARAITDDALLRAILDPTRRFAQARELLDEAITKAIGAPAAAIAQAVWLYLRGTFAAIRTSAEKKPAYMHDFPVDPALTDALPRSEEYEPFTAYHQAADAQPIRITEIETARFALPSNPHPVQVECERGHTFTADVRESSPTCPFCGIRGLKRGVNDLEKRRPELAAEFDLTRNGGLTPADVPVSSHRKCWWICPRGHNYQASPTNRSQNDQGCSVCAGRIIVAGVNDFASRCPGLAAEWHPANPLRPHRVSFVSYEEVTWICTRGHIFNATVNARRTGRDCSDCAAAEAAADRDLATTHPVIAAEWHPTFNHTARPPETLTAGSQKRAYWLCPAGHHYLARTDARTRGTGCPFCSRRRLLTGFNDLATTDPVLVLEWDKYRNPRPPELLMSTTEQYRWVCLAAGHEHTQSVQHRRKSNGCPKCPPADRIAEPHSLDAAA